MHSESVKLALYDIRDNVLLAREFVDGLTCERFSESRLHLYAVTRALEIISEASRIDAGRNCQHPGWSDNVAASYVWETVTVHLPPLLAAVAAEIKMLEGEI